MIDISQQSKKYEELEKTKPRQLEFFFNSNGKEKQYTNTIELYDTLPKYYYGNQNKIVVKEGEFLPILKRSFKNNDGIMHSLEIIPASILNSEGKTIQYYPAKREQLIEDVLRKLACEGRGEFLDNELGFAFSLYEVQKELEKLEHGYDLNAIKDALTICARSIIKIRSEDNSFAFESPLFSSLGVKNINGHNTTYIRFNPLVSKAIKEKGFRQLNFEQYMKHKKILSYWLHKRLSHFFIQASKNNFYSIKLTTIVTNSGMEFHKQISNTKNQIISSLEELIKNEILEKFEYDTILDQKRTNKIEDILFKLYPHPSFIRDMVKANIKYQKIQKIKHKNSQ